MIFLAYLILVALLVLFQKYNAKREFKVFYSYLGLKIIAVLAVSWLYKSYYQGTGDMFVFFDNASAWYKQFQNGSIGFLQWIGFEASEAAAHILPLEERSRFFTIFLSLLMPLAQGDFMLLSFIITAISVIPTWLLVKELKRTGIKSWLIYASILFVPSILFWTSGILKETLMLGLMASIGCSYLNWKTSKGILPIIILLVSTILLWKLKYYVPILLLPLLGLAELFTANYKLLQRLSFEKKVMLFLGLMLVSIAAVSLLHPVFNSGLFFDLVRKSYESILSSKAGSNFTFIDYSDNMQFVIFNAPYAFFTGLFRPFLWEVNTVISGLVGAEQFMFTVTTAFAIFSIFKIDLPENERFWIISGFIYIAAMATIISLSTPNFGSLVRYRVAYMPIAWLLNLYLINKYLSVRK
ncbi:hypothetical protein GCM10027429_10200 [Marivirga atlantica]|jgi:hypothetical protein|uniref:Uncharacterized protein n=1 Tax=Marivirga atlantica TaxID=1548457 RepID=A0A937AE83_9BACT|nr:hypothetical protein [Marivirga atlantica]MBL0764633.1 hypothetical protein [Marivirga atlantica]